MINRIIHEYKHTCSIAYFLNISYYFWMIKWKKDYEQFSNSESSAPALLFPCFVANSSLALHINMLLIKTSVYSLGIENFSFSAANQK